MSALTLSTPKRRPLRARLQKRQYSLTAAAAVLAYLIVGHLMMSAYDNPPVHFRIDVSPLLSASLVLKAHITGAVASFGIGSILMLGRKGRTLHRVLGYSWVATMTLTALSSFFLTGLNGDNFSLIHAISAWSIIILPMGVAAARRHDIKTHRQRMTGLFVGGMAVAGLFTFLPGRTMWSIFFAI
jgi:uncharacterized membrane protein